MCLTAVKSLIGQIVHRRNVLPEEVIFSQSVWGFKALAAEQPLVSTAAFEH